MFSPVQNMRNMPLGQTGNSRGSSNQFAYQFELYCITFDGVQEEKMERA